MFLTLLQTGSALALPPADQARPSVAFHYGANPPLAELKAFNIAVVEPSHVSDPLRHARPPQDGAHELFAYVSLGEVQPSRPYYRDLPVASLRGDNAAWGSRVIDQQAPGWREFFLDRIIDPLWQQGWRGFFLDTLDSYQLFAKTDAERQAQTRAMIAILLEFKRRYPQARLILNRGFELLPEIAPVAYAVAAESLYEGFDAGLQRYRPVPASDRAWLLGQLETVRERYGLPVIAIDYIDPERSDARVAARQTAQRIMQHGFIPWVSDGALQTLGAGSVEVLPRKVLVLVDSAPGVDLHYIEAQRFLGMPLNYLGLSYEFVDLARQRLPEDVGSDRYAGIVTWFSSGESHPALGPWLLRRIRAGLRVAMFDQPGFALDGAAAAALGLRTVNPGRVEQLRIHSRDAALIGFETEPLPDRAALLGLRLEEGQGRSLLRLADARGNYYDAAALTAWGGFALAPFVIRELPLMKQDKWVLQPLLFLQEALGLPSLPVPDVTTEGGRRMLLVHIDGDGFASRAEIPGAPLGAEVLRREVIERYHVPTTFSVIEGEVGALGLYPEMSAQLEASARRIFALPYVEAASHTYSHPFDWSEALASQSSQGAATPAPTAHGGRSYMALPGYRFELSREIKGTMDYINARLLPPGKKAAMLLWTGNCVPPPEALAETYQNGYLNMNGGDTVITESNRSWTAIAAQGLRKGGWYQVFAPNQNENVYTNNWTGPFYGFERVIETFRLTGQPHRFKPVNIYYHAYAATKPASLKALQKAYEWALAQPLTHVYASQYARKVLDFEETVFARELGSGDLLVRTGRDLRTLRLPPGQAAPALADSSGVAGIAPGVAGDYLILAAGQARLPSRSGAVTVPNLVEANGTVSDLSRSVAGNQHALRFILSSNGGARFGLAWAGACRVTADGRPLRHAVQGGAWATGGSVALAGQAPVPVRHYVIEGGAGAAAMRQRIEAHCPA